MTLTYEVHLAHGVKYRCTILNNLFAAIKRNEVNVLSGLTSVFHGRNKCHLGASLQE